jgi:AraC-like DNA-binding protein
MSENQANRNGSANTLLGSLDHPILTKLSDAVSKIAGVGFIVILPTESGWEQFCPGGMAARSEFCRLINGTQEGLRRCKMCHVLMTVAAGSSGQKVQRCHAGLSVLVAPIAGKGSNDAFSVLSTCMFISNDKAEAWREAKERGEKLGIHPAQLKKAFNELPCLDHDQEKIVMALMEVATEAVKEIKMRFQLQKELGKSKSHTHVKSLTESIVEQRLKEYGTVVFGKGGSKDEVVNPPGKVPVLIRVVEELIDHRPDITYGVAEIAAAARVTPNYFSSLFHNYTGKTFSKFLCEKRMTAAKSLLGDMTLSISEVAFRVGYSDAGYFARRFRQSTGSSPGDWRQRLS